MIVYGFVKKQFVIREHDISYKKGLFWKSHITIPYNRVQHCEVNQGPIDRFYKIAKIKIYTAGGSTSDVTIPGLNPARAERIKGFVLKQIAHDEEE
jgi:membrane protein YdbS with pleckstrin-like domain